ncbi:AEC family transporter [Hydrogenophaga sp.]|uniref:AEC family transporter n=1 Tax=Hydrogenophaga sp. TaxID=1904254 RepID=UPI0025C4CBDC|nr:AEC family transporter [Hydrogenophaga sp.]
MATSVLLKLLAMGLIVALGWGAARLRWLGPGDVARTLSNAAFYLFVPALLFRTSSRMDFSAMPWSALAVFFLPAWALMLAVVVWNQRRVAHASPAAPGVRAMTACFGNSVQLGIPLAASVLGEAGLAIHLTIVSLHALTLLTLMTAQVELALARDRARQGLADGHLGRLLRDTARATVIHPVVLPIIMGLLVNASGIGVPSLIDELLIQLGQAVVPLCLVLIGVSLNQYGFVFTGRGMAALVVVKLLVMPAVVLVVGHWVFGLEALPLTVVVMAAALPSGSNPLLFAQRYKVLEAETTSAITVSTLTFVLTAPLWLAVMAWVVGA